MSDKDKMREQFEKWATGEGLCVAPYGASYLDEKTHTAWIAWQAAQAEAVPVGMRVSVDTSTGEHDAGNRVFAVVTGQQDDGRGGLMLLCEEESRNFEQSVPVVGDALFYASDSTPTAESQIQYDVCAYQKDYSFFPVYRKPTHSISADELERLRRIEAVMIKVSNLRFDYVTLPIIREMIDAAIAAEEEK